MQAQPVKDSASMHCTNLVVNKVLDDRVSLSWTAPQSIDKDDEVVFTTEWRTVAGGAAPWRSHR